MKVFIEKYDNEINIEFEGTVIELLDKFKINKETVIVIKGDELTSEDQKLNNQDSIKILSVISGG